LIAKRTSRSCGRVASHVLGWKRNLLHNLLIADQRGSLQDLGVLLANELGGLFEWLRFFSGVFRGADLEFGLLILEVNLSLRRASA